MFVLLAATAEATGSQELEFTRSLDLASRVEAELPPGTYLPWADGRVRTETRIRFSDARGAGGDPTRLRVARTYAAASTRTSVSDFEPPGTGSRELVSESEYAGRTLLFEKGPLGWTAVRCEPAFVALQPLAETQLFAFESVAGEPDGADLRQALMLPAGRLTVWPRASARDDAEPTGRLVMLERAVQLCFSVGSFDGELERTDTATGPLLRGRLRKSVDLRPAFTRALDALEPDKTGPDETEPDETQPGARRPFPGELGLHADVVADVRGRLECDDIGLPLASDCTGEVRIELRVREVVFDGAGGRHEIECVYELTGTLEQRLGSAKRP